MTPGTVSSACKRCSGERRAICRADSNVLADAGEVSRLGAAPTTVIDSDVSGSTRRSIVSSMRVISTGRATCPLGSVMITWNGGAGCGSQVNAPLASVLTVPGMPGIEMVAPTTGVPDFESSTRPLKAVALGGHQQDWRQEHAQGPAKPERRMRHHKQETTGAELLPELVEHLWPLFPSSSSLLLFFLLPSFFFPVLSLSPLQLLPQHVEIRSR